MARAMATFSRFGLSSRRPPIRVAMSRPSPATRLHSPTCLSGERVSMPWPISRAESAHDAFLPLHAERARDVARSQKLRQAEAQAEPAEGFRKLIGRAE